MLICHNLVSRMKRRYCTHVICQTCMQQCTECTSMQPHRMIGPDRQCLSFQRRDREVVGRWAHHPVFSTTSGVSNTITRQRRVTTTAVAWRSCHTHENCMHAEQIIIIFYIFYFIFCSMYLVLFSIVLYRSIVTVFTDNVFLYNYRRRIHQIIHLSPVGCFTPARGKSVQKIAR